MTTARIEAQVATTSGDKYVRQLCKHWSHKFETKVEDKAGGSIGTVTFPTAAVTMTADETGITIAIEGPSREEVEPLTGVVADHVDRFAFREGPLVYEWAWR